MKNIHQLQINVLRIWKSSINIYLVTQLAPKSNFKNLQQSSWKKFNWDQRAIKKISGNSLINILPCSMNFKKQPSTSRVCRKRSLNKRHRYLNSWWTCKYKKFMRSINVLIKQGRSGAYKSHLIKANKTLKTPLMIFKRNTTTSNMLRRKRSILLALELRHHQVKSNKRTKF